MGKHGFSWNSSTYCTVLPHLKQYLYAGKYVKQQGNPSRIVDAAHDSFKEIDII
jgi:hypothetical protein